MRCGRGGARFAAWRAQRRARVRRCPPARGVRSLPPWSLSAAYTFFCALVEHACERLLERTDGQFGLITMCAGGGMAPAIVIERV